MNDCCQAGIQKEPCPDERCQAEEKPDAVLFSDAGMVISAAALHTSPVLPPASSLKQTAAG